MSKEIMFWLLMLVTLSIFFNKFYGLQLTNIQKNNVYLKTVQNKMIPEKYLQDPDYSSFCINWKVTEADLMNKKKVILFFTNSPISFSCNTNFYNWTDWLNNLIELENRINAICIVENTKDSNENYFCTKK